MAKEKLPDSSTSPRGFACLSRERRREIASLGGQAAHRQGHAHQFTKQEAQAAGRKGGLAVSQDRAHMARIGQKGGTAQKRPRSAGLADMRRGDVTVGDGTISP